MKRYLILITIALLWIGCNKDDDNGIPEPGGPDPQPQANVEVQDFMWKAMNLWYFWQADVTDLADTRFNNDEDYTNFLRSEDNPEDFFKKLLFTEDRFSFFNDDYKELVNNFAGVSKSNGMEFGLSRFGSGNDVFGFVQYVVPGSDADAKGVKRGDIFKTVNGQQLFQDRANASNNNYELFDLDTYTIDISTIIDNTITDTGNEITLNKQENLVENPVFLTKTLDVNGIKVGYLMYNRFTSNFDEELNNAFGELRAANVSELVLDMRYNPGGSVNSSRLLASMVYGTRTNDLYIRQRWNPKIQAAFGAAQLEDFFADTTGDGTPINTLNLSKVYVLATRGSASASELVMNGLAPYVDVIHIGTTTRGKNEFSLTFVDDPNREGAPYVYTESRESNINPNNSWAIQPLCGRNENADGFFDYTSGLAPDIELPEDIANLGVLGDENEPLLARALQEISGATAKRSFTVKMPANTITNSKMFTQIKDNMYLDKPLNNITIQ
ncbi:S41 family peptidase [Costertonia aggregata]|uniref:Carboxyl-terminal protease n=1 Tax=Costertonia aggregata TaxID=343403 RepID=A0A7H9AKD9_9FLAO|nr:S41 family peptidase [Costertonia aggregata]QLG43918.1 carboxyl-terminal protease [Costertonia aggregata]